MDFEDDDWFFDSVKNYKNLFMYNLQHPVTCMDWVDERSLVVVTSSLDRNEIIELSLPDKLVIGNTEDTGLIKDRDFHQENGGFSSNNICCMKHIPQSRQVCTSEVESSGVQVWNLGSSESDLILPTAEFKAQESPKQKKGEFSKIAVFEQKPSCLVFGSCLENLCLADIEAKSVIGLKNVEDSTEHTSISVIEFLDENTLLCCCEKLGNISLVDLREKDHKDYPISKTNCMNKTDVKPCSYWTIGVTSDKVYRLSASGDIVVSDVRNGTDSVLSEVSTQLHCTTNHCNIQVQASSQHKDVVSISGFDGNVYVYDTHRTPTETLGSFYTEPIFTHEGHVRNCDDHSETVKTLCQMWHSSNPDLIISTASDSSLHAWEYHLHNS